MVKAAVTEAAVMQAMTKGNGLEGSLAKDRKSQRRETDKGVKAAVTKAAVTKAMTKGNGLEGRKAKLCVFLELHLLPSLATEIAMTKKTGTIQQHQHLQGKSKVVGTLVVTEMTMEAMVTNISRDKHDAEQ